MDAKPIGLLLVDDNDDDIYIAQQALADVKLIKIVGVARNGEEAMAYLRREHGYKDAQEPDMMLLDINMPKTNGIEVLLEIKADSALRHLPVIVYTTGQRDEDILRAYVAGACSYIPKPVDFRELKDLMKNLELYWTRVSRIPGRFHNQLR
jgi:CheY-like chemotaxis protein